MGADEEGTLAQLKAHRRALVDPKFAEHRGRIVKTTGDGMRWAVSASDTSSTVGGMARLNGAANAMKSALQREIASDVFLSLISTSLNSPGPPRLRTLVHEHQLNTVRRRSSPKTCPNGATQSNKMLDAGLALPRGPLADYLQNYKRRGGKAVEGIQSVVRRNVLPGLGSLLVHKLTTRRLVARTRAWPSGPGTGAPAGAPSPIQPRTTRMTRRRYATVGYRAPIAGAG
jgi:hypothetical protein